MTNKNKYSTVEKLAHTMQQEESEKLIKSFRQFMVKQKTLTMLPELVIADECIKITNLRPRTDEASIIFTKKGEQ